MVRLKDAPFYDSASYTIFQFHNGTIKSTSEMSKPICLNYFNSTMVRLKGFQAVRYDVIYVISIPQWYD